MYWLISPLHILGTQPNACWTWHTEIPRNCGRISVSEHRTWPTPSYLGLSTTPEFLQFWADHSLECFGSFPSSADQLYLCVYQLCRKHTGKSVRQIIATTISEQESCNVSIASYRILRRQDPYAGRQKQPALHGSSDSRPIQFRSDAEWGYRLRYGPALRWDQRAIKKLKAVLSHLLHLPTSSTFTEEKSRHESSIRQSRFRRRCQWH